MKTSPICYEIPSIVPGRLLLSRGTARDYTRLARFHYRAKRPATWAQVWTIRYFHTAPSTIPIHDLSAYPQTLVAIGILSWPTLACSARDRALNLSHLHGKEKSRYLNRHVRTISRIAVHPTFRSLGLSVALVRCMLYHCKTRYVEALASMARAHPCFALAGMTRHRPSTPTSPLYYLHDRHAAAQAYIAPLREGDSKCDRLTPTL